MCVCRKCTCFHFSKYWEAQAPLNDPLVGMRHTFFTVNLIIKSRIEYKWVNVYLLATPEYYKHVFSTKAFDGILRGEKPVIYGKNLNVTSYTQPQAKQAGNRKNGGNEEEDEGDAGRKNHDPVGRAHAPGLASHTIISRSLLHLTK